MKEERKNEKEETTYEEETEFGSDLDEVKDKLQKLKEKLKKCSEEKAEYLDGWQRAKAEMINYRKRQEEQMGEWIKLSQVGLISDLLPILDSLDVAINNQESHLRQGYGGQAGIRNQELGGIEMVKKQFAEILRQHGLEEIKALGEKFNPEIHEAVETVESDKEEGIVIEEVQRGYLLNGKVIRTAKVKVSKK